MSWLDDWDGAGASGSAPGAPSRLQGRSSGQGVARTAGPLAAGSSGAAAAVLDSSAEGMVALTLESEERPSWVLERVDFAPKSLRTLSCCSENIALAMDGGQLVRLNLANPAALVELELARKTDERLLSMFQDPTGQHILANLYPACDVVYVNAQSRKARVLSKLKGTVLESVAWSKQGVAGNNTGPVLLGTQVGSVIEICVTDGKERYIKPVLTLGSKAPVTGLAFERFPPGRAEQSDKLYVLLCTPTRLYQAIGGPTFEALFATSFREASPVFDAGSSEQEVKTSILPHGKPQLVTYAQHAEQRANRVAWLTSQGVYTAGLVFGSQNPGESCITDGAMVPYPVGAAMSSPASPPISLVLTEWHLLLLHPDRIQAVSQLSRSLVAEVVFAQQRTQVIGSVRGIARDEAKHSLWLYTDTSVYAILAKNEDCQVWRILLDKGQFDAAIKHAGGDERKAEVVFTAQADHYFAQHQYALAAKFYGQTHRPFEEVALKFVDANEYDALHAYLLKRVESFRKQDAMQLTALCTWIIELSVAKLNRLREERKTDAYSAALEEVKAFLNEHKTHVSTATTLNLLASHGHTELMLFFAAAVLDYRRVISHHLTHGDYPAALTVLGGQSNPDLYYQFSPALMEQLPFDMVTAWMRMDGILQPHLLIPAMMRYDATKNPPGEPGHQVLRYLHHCVARLGNKEAAIHNYLLSLYVALPGEEKLLAYLSSQDDPPYYDRKYALRLCSKLDKPHACVLIYGAMGMHEEAVRKALSLSLPLAKQHADRAVDDDMLRKKLWRMIAQYAIEQRQNVKEAIALLSECDILKIEDILPFFPDFVQIDDFKEEICASLEEYNQHIEQLKADMDQSTRSADVIRLDIRNLRKRYGFVGASQSCDLCSKPVLTRQFYLFPCQHVFHSDCLTNNVTRHMNDYYKRRVAELQVQLAKESQHEAARAGTADDATSAASGAQAGGPVSQAEMVLSPLERTKRQLDDLVGAECPFCGDAMIRSIDRPFIDLGESDVLRTWEL